MLIFLKALKELAPVKARTKLLTGRNSKYSET
jgi:hypothetical protein